MNVKAPTPPPGKNAKSRRWPPWSGRLLTLLFFSAVAYLLFRQTRSVEWDAVLASMRDRPVESLLTAAVFAVASHALYGCFDLLGRHVTGHRLPVMPTMLINFVSYAFNLNLGALAGGVAFRYRLYSRFGLDAGTVTRVIATSMLTNWLGYMLIAGVAFWQVRIPLPRGWEIGGDGLRMAGVAMLLLVAVYFLLCAYSPRRTWIVRGHEVTLPSSRLAMLQLFMSSVNWLLIAGVAFSLLDQKIPFPVVLIVLLVAAMAGVIAHVPAGLGVIEAVFLSLLSDRLPASELLAMLLTYRAVYYLVPLAIAVPVYFAIEAHAKARKNGG